MVCIAKKGHLPWDMTPLPAQQLDQKDPLIYQKTMQRQKDQKKWDRQYLTKKLETEIPKLTEGLPVFADYFHYCTSVLKFGERPNYDYLISKFEYFCKEHNIVIDDKHDWVVKRNILLEKKLERELELKRLEALKKVKPGSLADRKKLEAQERLQAIRKRERDRKAEEEAKIKESSAPKKIKALSKNANANEIDYDDMSPYKANRLRTEELRSEMREKVRDRIDTVIKFEIEQAKRPKEDGNKLSYTNSAEKLLMGADDDLSNMS